MAIERNFITPAGINILTTANVVGNTTSSDYFGDTVRSATLPSMSFDFVGSKRLDPRITFERSTGATYTDERGIIRRVGINEPRFDHANGVCQGLLIEDSRINYFVNESSVSQGFLRAGIAVGPDDRAAIRWVLPAGIRVGFPSLGRPPTTFAFNLAQGNSIDFVFTGFFGPCYGSPQVEPLMVIECNTNDATNSLFATFQFDGNTGTFKNLGGNVEFSFPIATSVTRHINGMWKVVQVFRYTQPATLRNRMTCYFQPREVGGLGDYNIGVESGFEFSCCQVEVGTQPTSFIPTTNAVAVRSVDRAHVNGTNFSSWYNQSGGSLYIHAQQTANATSRGVVSIGANETSGNNSIYHLYIAAAGPQIGSEFFNNGPNIAAGFTSYTPMTPIKAVQTFTTGATNFASFHLNGTQIMNAGTASQLPRSVDRMVIGGDRFNNGWSGPVSGITFNGYIKKIAFYSSPLTNNQAQALTR